MICLHFPFHYNPFTSFQVGGLTIVEDHFCLATQTINRIKRQVVGIIYRVVFNGFCFIQFGDDMHECTRLLFSRINGIVGGKIPRRKYDQPGDERRNTEKDDNMCSFHTKKFTAKVTQSACIWISLVIGWYD